MLKLITLALVVVMASCEKQTEVNASQSSQKATTNVLITKSCTLIDSVGVVFPVGISQIVFDFSGNCNRMGMSGFAVLLNDVKNPNALKCTLTTPTKTAIRLGKGHWYEFFNQDILGEVATFEVNNTSNKPITAWVFAKG